MMLLRAQAKLVFLCCIMHEGIVSMETLPFLYDQFEDNVDYFVGNLIQDMKMKYRMFDSMFLNKIPRGPVKEKKVR